MKLEMEPTPEMYGAPINGVDVPVRIWKGKTEDGIVVEVYVLAVVPIDKSEFIKLGDEFPDYMKLSRKMYKVDAERRATERRVGSP